MSTLTVTLREGGLADLADVMAVMDDSFEPCFGEAWTASQCAGLMPMPGVWLTLAREDGGTIGFALSRIVADEAELLLLAVRRGAQGRGVGKSLLARFEALARRRGAARLHLEVRDGNRAVKLYETAGFGLIGRRPHYYSGPDGQNYDALTFAKIVSI
ncbi:GNAT family N-acetyltransferase [Sphingosinicella sp. LHD-64]|uniref:GNAT family N-acetyltransferase n=1 Tax=Sphingosinicella sp. LHD-64 TaxID=3072139 RepID=UPI00280E2262|nr:GNAT family N-acetyltransferase [Sphingosinicella sp. LHD-64]MDQ8758303.1 GNAT family N-acetyltransferase [Sphingosinicella sp. LHD-64]